MKQPEFVSLSPEGICAGNENMHIFHVSESAISTNFQSCVLPTGVNKRQEFLSIYVFYALVPFLEVHKNMHCLIGSYVKSAILSTEVFKTNKDEQISAGNISF